MSRKAVTSLVFCLLVAAACVPRATTSTGVAASPLLRHCPPGAADRMGCLERALLDTLRLEGIAAAMTTLERISDADPEIRKDGHVYAHVIGLAAYTTPDEVGRAFAQCTPAHQSGCYHGVIQSYFVDVSRGGPDRLTPEAINGLCADYREREDGRWLLFQCAHGMGHGLTMVHGYHLPRALEACDLVESEWEREACYGGVFMENIVQAVAPHHTTGRPQQAEHGGHHAAHGGHAPTAPEVQDEHADHDEHAGHRAAAAEFPPLDASDLHYPCSVLAERYLPSCYLMQTSVALYHTKGDFGAAARMCDGAPEHLRATCYISLGRDASSYSVQDMQAGLRMCAVGDPGQRPWCHVGYAKNLIDLTARAEDGIAYCRLVPSSAKAACYRAVGEQIAVLAPGEAQREEKCATVEGGHVEACRAGAGLPATVEAGE